MIFTVVIHQHDLLVMLDLSCDDPSDTLAAAHAAGRLAGLERLRRPFQRGKGLQAISDSGLGPALVNAVAEQNGGRLELGRTIEGGLCARIVLSEKLEPA